ncbi:MAG: heavy-metal-associated domain-containing protein [Sphingomonas sp.]
MAFARFRTARHPLGLAVLALAALVLSPSVLAQIDGGRQGVAPVDSSGSFEVGGIEVDVVAKSAQTAREAGWRIAQRKGWQLLSRRLGGGGGLVSDGTLDALVAGIVVENEQLGPNRYIARLGVLFDRSRSAEVLGVAGQISRSPPLLVIPVQWSGGAAHVFEQRTAWQEAWARFRTGNSTVDYVRPTGTGPDALLLNAGQVLRPGRGWWRTVLGQYGALDVVIPVVHLYPTYPGGPVVGAFQARFGPDNRLITAFNLRVNSADAIPALLDEGIKRIDAAYQGALNSGILRVDPSLFAPPAPEPLATEETGETPVVTDEGDSVVTDRPATSTISVQADTPSAASVASVEAALRGVPGVRAAATTSLALGGISVVRVGYEGSIVQLQAALEARGWQVLAGNGALRIFRTVSPAPPNPAPDNATQ